MKLEYLGEHLHPGTSLRIPWFPGAVPAGFPSPADDYMGGKLDLNEHLIRHPAATFYCRVSGDSMKGAGIFDGSLVIDPGGAWKPGIPVRSLYHFKLLIMLCEEYGFHLAQ